MITTIGMRQVHPKFSAPEKEEFLEDDIREDYLFNYHQCKLSFGLIFMAFEDTVKTGDEQCKRINKLYKLILLIYMSHKHTKYPYVTLHYLVHISAMLPKFEAA